MKSKKQIRALIARAKELEAKSGGTVVFPAWMKDEKKVVQNRKMTPAEIQEFNSMMRDILRSSVALVYLAECKSRWGKNITHQYLLMAISRLVLPRKWLSKL